MKPLDPFEHLKRMIRERARLKTALSYADTRQAFASIRNNIALLDKLIDEIAAEEMSCIPPARKPEPYTVKWTPADELVNSFLPLPDKPEPYTGSLRLLWFGLFALGAVVWGMAHYE